MPILANPFSNGVLGIKYVPPGKKMSTASIGMINSMESYDFGIIERNELIEVTSGTIVINGVAHTRGQVCKIEPNTRVVFKALELSTWRCEFPGETR